MFDVDLVKKYDSINLNMITHTASLSVIILDTKGFLIFQVIFCRYTQCSEESTVDLLSACSRVKTKFLFTFNIINPCFNNTSVASVVFCCKRRAV